MAVSVTFVGPSYSGGSGSDSFTSADYADAAAAVAAESNGFIVFANPIDQGQTTSLGKSRAASIAWIKEIVTL